LTVYISGPISGLPNDNREAFASAAAWLRSAGHDPINPLEIADRLPLDSAWADYMREDLRAMLDAEAVYLLPGWQMSRGACLEYRVAEALGMTIAHHDTLLAEDR
jgi:hypothetical protein